MPYIDKFYIEKKELAKGRKKGKVKDGKKGRDRKDKQTNKQEEATR